jgi:hypothetical protein
MDLIMPAAAAMVLLPGAVATLLRNCCQLPQSDCYHTPLQLNKFVRLQFV